MERKPPVESKEWILEPETEYRFELDPGASLAIKLISGHAEIFGAELAEGKPYLFGSECKAAVFSWQGCVIEPSTEYVSDETPAGPYANVHLALEQMRVRALRSVHGSPPENDERANSEPPRVLVMGPENSGKTTVCKTLVNYAVRSGQDWCPLYVNVDPGEGGWAIPGCMAAAPIYSPLATASAANPLGSTATSAPTALSSNALLPLSYWYGHTDSKRNPRLMERLIRNLGLNVSDKYDIDIEGKASGLIVDTPASFAASTAATNDLRQTLIKACIDAFQINVILVVGHEKLNVEMQRTYGSSHTVVKIPKSGGVVELDNSYRERVRNYQLHAYMYGHTVEAPPGIANALLGGEPNIDLVLSPSSTVIGFDDLVIYRIGEEAMAPSSALPIGAARVVSEMQPVKVDPSYPGSRLLNAVLAILAPPDPDENERCDDDILDLPVTGFVVITALDYPKRKMTILSPNRGSVVGKTALVGSLEWQE